MSLKKVVVIALGSALAVIAGNSLMSTAVKNAVSVMASAVWGS